MVKRFLLLFMLLAVMFCSLACNDEIYGYKTINLGDFGQMQIPEEWVCSVKDDIIYFTDKALHTDDYITYMKGFIFPDDEEPTFSDENKDLEEMYETYFEQRELCLDADNYSNEVHTELCEMKINGIIRTIDVLEIYSDSQVYVFFSIDKSIPKETIKNIANSVTYEKNYSEH